jgi:hypothetical protein
VLAAARIPARSLPGIVCEVQATIESLPGTPSCAFLLPRLLTKGANGRKARMRAARAGPRYGAAHIFLTSHAPDAALSPLRDAPGLAPRLRTLKEFNLEFLAVESQVRHPLCTRLTAPGSIAGCAGPASAQSRTRRGR